MFGHFVGDTRTLFWHGMASFGMDWQGLACFGKEFCIDWPGMASFGMEYMFNFFKPTPF
jgi:hypothetical protein